jgi:2-oxoisovalerate dehydrogenase E1 component
MPLIRARKSLERIRALGAGTAHDAIHAPRLSIDGHLARQLFSSQLLCRVTDIEAHELRARNQGYYTICSAGHEGNVALGALTGPTDPALLHYRSGAFFIARARSSGADRLDAAQNLLLSLAASASDPISGGRHKVFGSVQWGVPPQTSTISSHLPKAVGMALSIDRLKKLKVDTTAQPGVVATRPSSIVLCSFGDASLNHSTAQGALNAASWAAYQ